jgi:ketosteroid isomerase-like protein
VSQENVEVVRREVAAWERDDIEGWLSMIAADVEWLTAVERDLGSACRIYHGHEGMRELWKLWRTEFDDFWIETDEIRDLGGNRVLRLAHMRFRGPASGIQVESQLALLYTLRDGKIVRSDDYRSHKRALKAVGLEG